MDQRIPHGNWLDDTRFQALVKQLAPLRMGGWRVDEVSAALSSLGWSVPAEPDTRYRDLTWVVPPRQGPKLGLLKLTGPDRERITALEVSVTDGLDDDEGFAQEVGFVRAAWRVMQEEFGAPTLWAGRDGARPLWRFPHGTSLAVHFSSFLHHVTLEMVDSTRDADAAALPDSPSQWRAADPTDLPAPAPAVPTASWGDVRTQLATALGALCRDTPLMPGRFILHLESARDPKRFVQAWNDGLALVVEATGFIHHPESADWDALRSLGWQGPDDLLQGRFENAMNESGHAKTAASMLVEALRALVDLPDLTYNGTLSGRGHHLHLDLPPLGLPRTAPDPQ